nr:reverse transcriptase domain-containing protein [Tanacetum cinerariifolium]
MVIENKVKTLTITTFLFPTIEVLRATTSPEYHVFFPHPIIILSDSDVDDTFSSKHSLDYISASPDYSPASPGNTPSESSNNSYGLVPIASPILSLFHDDPYIKVMHAYNAIIPPQVPIPPPIIVPPSLMNIRLSETPVARKETNDHKRKFNDRRNTTNNDNNNYPNNRDNNNYPNDRNNNNHSNNRNNNKYQDNRNNENRNNDYHHQQNRREKGHYKSQCSKTDNSTFHVSNLKKCISDESLVIPMKEIWLNDKLSFVEEPVEIIDREVKQLRQTYCNHMRSGNTTHANYSFPEYDSFCFEIEPDQERLINLVKNDIPDDSSNDTLLEEVDLFLFDNSIPPGIENIADDPEGDIRFLEELLIDDSILSHESFDSNFEDNPSILRPPPEPPDAETNVGEEIAVVMNCKDKFYDDYQFFKFDKIFSLLSAESEDTIFDPGISD